MADLVAIKDATDTTVNVLTDEVVDGVLGTGHKQLIAVADGTIGGTNKLVINANGEAAVASNDLSASGSLSAANQTVQLNLNGQGIVFVQSSGTWAGSQAFEGTIDGTNWFALVGTVLSTGGNAPTFVGNGNWMCMAAGLAAFRVRRTVSTSGTAVITLRGSTAAGTTMIASGLPGGSNTLGGVSISGSPTIQGNSALGVAVSGNPVRIGGVARSGNSATVSDGQQSHIVTDKLGRLVVTVGHVREQVAKSAITLTNTTTATTIVPAAGASVFVDITHLSITNGSSTATTVTLSDGTVSMVYNLTAGGGVNLNFLPALPATTANTAWTLTCGNAVTSVYCNAIYTKNT